MHSVLFDQIHRKALYAKFIARALSEILALGIQPIFSVHKYLDCFFFPPLYNCGCENVIFLRDLEKMLSRYTSNNVSTVITHACKNARRFTKSLISTAVPLLPYQDFERFVFAARRFSKEA